MNLLQVALLNIFFFFLMIRLPPISTLFPYTTLFRSTNTIRRWDVVTGGELPLPPGPTGPRSEEHTSELQSHVNLVCRLLLEKKKKSAASRVTFLFKQVYSS